jgi:hypothetical protein
MTFSVPPAALSLMRALPDLYVRCAVEGGEWKESDIHMRARDGKGSFNWRMKFPLELPLMATLRYLTSREDCVSITGTNR